MRQAGRRSGHPSGGAQERAARGPAPRRPPSRGLCVSGRSCARDQL